MSYRSDRKNSRPPFQRTLFRQPEEGIIAGVCAGLADYLDKPVGAVRVVTVLLMLCGMFPFIVGGYLILALLLPVLDTRSSSTTSVYEAHRQLRLIQQYFVENEQKLRQLERYIVSDHYQTYRKFRDL